MVADRCAPLVKIHRRKAARTQGHVRIHRQRHRNVRARSRRQGRVQLINQRSAEATGTTQYAGRIGRRAGVSVSPIQHERATANLRQSAAASQKRLANGNAVTRRINDRSAGLHIRRTQTTHPIRGRRPCTQGAAVEIEDAIVAMNPTRRQIAPVQIETAAGTDAHPDFTERGRAAVQVPRAGAIPAKIDRRGGVEGAARLRDDPGAAAPAFAQRHKPRAVLVDHAAIHIEITLSGVPVAPANHQRVADVQTTAMHDEMTRPDNAKIHFPS